MSIAIIMGLIPPVILLCYIFHLDKIEHEPVGLVLKLFIFGMLFSTLGASILEELGDFVLSLFGDPESSAFLMILESFLIIAPAEEFCKRFVVMRTAWKHPAFNYRFDAVVYCTAAALGFAASENILYIFILDLDFYSSLYRLIPVHTICGIFMGICLGQAKAAEAAGSTGLKKKYMQRSLLIPVLIHAFYDSGVSTDNDGIVIGTFTGVIILTCIAIHNLRKSAREDMPLISPGISFSNEYNESEYFNNSNPYGYPPADQQPHHQPYTPADDPRDRRNRPNLH